MSLKLLVLLNILSIIFASEEECINDKAVIESTIGKLQGKCSIVNIDTEKTKVN